MDGQKLKISYLSQSPVPSQKANSVHVMRMCEAFAQNGHDVTLVCRRGDTLSDPSIYDFYDVTDNFELRYINWSTIPAAGILYGLRVGRYLLEKRRDIDLAYARCPYSALSACFLKIPLIYEAHALPRTIFHQQLEALILKYARLRSLIVISQALKDDYEQLFARMLSQKKIIVAHDGANIKQPFTKTQDERIHEHRLKIVYTGSLLPGKGVAIVIAIAKQLPQHDFHIIGGPIEVWHSYYTHDVPANIYYYGFLPPSSITAWQQEADILLLPNQSKVFTDHGRVDIGRWTSPLKLFEYMASGSPIIASNLPVLCEVLHHGENALCVAPDVPKSWVKAIQRLSDNPYLATKIAEQAYKDLINNYTWQQRAVKVLI
jgi:glycosyltransferase involved in cell wall biosynthesis